MSTNGAPILNDNIELTTDLKVYSPAEDTFLLANNLEIYKDDKVLEIGVGTGYISILAANKAQYVWGTDVNPKAVKISKKNADLNNIDNTKFLKTEYFPKKPSKFDLIILNPPYLPEEEIISRKKPIDRSWGAGENGRKVTDTFINKVDSYLKSEGRIQMIQSSISGIEKTLEKLKDLNYKVEITAEKKLFFEKLVLITAYKK